MFSYHKIDGLAGEKIFKKILWFGSISLLLSDPLIGELSTCSPSCYDYSYNPPSRVGPDCVWEGHVDYLYLEARSNYCPIELQTVGLVRQDDLTITPNLVLSQPLTIVPKEFAYKSNSGFRMGFGAILPSDQFSISFDWLHYRTDATLFANSSFDLEDLSGVLINPIGGFPESGFEEAFLSGSYKSNTAVHVNELNLRIGREYFWVPGIRFTPTLALNYLDIKSRFQGQFFPISSLQGNFFTTTFNTANINSSFAGLGVKGGLETVWDLGCGLGIWGNSRGGLLWGRYRTKAVSYANRLALEGTQFGGEETHLIYHNIVPTLEFGIGLEWENNSLFAGDLKIKAGWEGFYYYDQTTLSLEPQSVSQPLTLQGLVLSFSYSM